MCRSSWIEKAIPGSRNRAQECPGFPVVLLKILGVFVHLCVLYCTMACHVLQSRRRRRFQALLVLQNFLPSGQNGESGRSETHCFFIMAFDPNHLRGSFSSLRKAFFILVPVNSKSMECVGAQAPKKGKKREKVAKNQNLAGLDVPTKRWQYKSQLPKKRRYCMSNVFRDDIV